MDRRGFLTMTAGVGMAAVTAGCGEDGESAGAQGGETVRLGDVVPDSNPQVAAERHFAERVAALTEDRFTVEVYPEGKLGDHTRMNEQLREGSLQLTKTLASNLIAFDERIGVLSLPYVFTAKEEVFAALDGDLGSRLGSIVDEADLILLGFFDSGARNVYTTERLVRTPADLEGLRIRVPQDDIMIDTFDTLGAEAVPLATNEVASALETGVIDAAENGLIMYVTAGHVDLATYWSWTRHQYGVDMLLASKQWFSELADADQEAIRQAGHEAVELERQLWQAQTEEYTAEIQARNIQISDDVDVAAFQEAVRPVIDRRRESLGELIELLPIG